MNIKFPELNQFRFIRQLQRTEQDFEALAECFNRFNDPDSWPSGFGTSTHAKETVARSFEGKNLEGHFVAVAPDNPNRIIGVCFCMRSTVKPNTWYVDLLGVDPAYQKKGFGKALLMKALHFTLEQGGDILFLNTWSGNLKAVPLYKRQGYKWRPRTDVLMENYLPQLLTFPPFVKFFEKYCWYDVFKPVITQEPDEETDNLMWVYLYEFESDEGENLRVWIDRSIAAVSGFAITSQELSITCKLQLQSSEQFIGIDDVRISLYLENHENRPRTMRVSFDCSRFLAISTENDLMVTLEPHEKRTITVLASFSDAVPEMDLKINSTRYSEVTVTAQVHVDDQSFPLKVGIIPRRAVLVKSIPSVPMFLAGTDDELTIELDNRMNQPVPVMLSISGDDVIQFTKTEYHLTVSELDTSLNIPITIKNCPSKVGKLTVSVKVKDGGRLLDEQNLGLFIFNEPKTLIWEDVEDFIASNGDIIVQVPKVPKKLNSLRLSSRRMRMPSIRLAPLLLGYPFDVFGSEFHSKPLNHEIHEQEKALLIKSTGVSEVKKGVVLARELYVFTKDEMVDLVFSLENRSDQDTHQEMGIMVAFWPELHEDPLNLYYMDSGGVKRIPTELVDWDVDMNGCFFKEGWMAIEFEDGVLGILFDEDTLVRFKQDEGVFLLEFKIKDLNPGDHVKTTPTRVLFSRHWQEVRQQWWTWRYQKEISDEDAVRLATDFLKMGLKVHHSDEPSRSVILDKNDLNFYVGFRSSFPIKISATFILPKLKSMIFNPLEIKTENVLTKEWQSRVRASLESEDRMLAGELVIDLDRRIIQVPISMAIHDSKKNIISTVHVDEGSLDCFVVNNGYLTFKVSPQFSASLFHVSVNSNPDFNYLKTFYPKVVPYLFSDQFFGGIIPHLYPKETWRDRRFSTVTFTGQMITRGKWRGVSIRSPVLRYDDRVKGLPLFVSYLTLPDAPIILVDMEVHNQSGARRQMTVGLKSYLNCSGSGKDLFYCEEDYQSVGSLHSLDHNSYLGFRSKSGAAFHQHPDVRPSLGMVVISERPSIVDEGIGVLNRNLQLAEFVFRRQRVTLGPNKSYRLQIGFILAETWKQVVPFKDLIVDL